MCKIFLDSVFFSNCFRNIEGVATPESYMAASTECSAFPAAIAFSLGKLGLSHISLKKEQRSAILAEYQRRDVCVKVPS